MINHRTPGLLQNKRQPMLYVRHYSLLALLLFAFIHGLLRPAQCQVAVAPCQPSVRTLKLDGITVEAFVRGKGEPMVLVPGQGLGADSLSMLAEDICKQGFHTITINLRGVGGSKGTLEGL